MQRRLPLTQHEYESGSRSSSVHEIHYDIGLNLIYKKKHRSFKPLIPRMSLKENSVTSYAVVRVKGKGIPSLAVSSKVLQLPPFFPTQHHLSMQAHDGQRLWAEE